MRSLSQNGPKLDLAARAMLAFEREDPIRQDLEVLDRGLKDTYSKLLSEYGIPDPRTIKEWYEDVSLWPCVDLGKIFSFIISKKAFETEYIGQYKAKKAFSYFMSGFVHEINSSKVSPEMVVLKSRVTPSQKVRDDPREAWILCRKNGDILCAYCSCTAGFGECCNHVVAILYKVEYANTKGYIDPACTDLACSWNKTTDRGVKPLKIKDAVIQKHDVWKSDKRHVLQSSFKKIFDPRPIDMSGKEEERIRQFIDGVSKIKSNAGVTYVVEPPKDYACPLPLEEIASSVLSANQDKNEQELVSLFAESLSFNENQIMELERSTRAQAGSLHWKEQRIGCITATKIKDVSTKVKTLARLRGKRVKVTPLLARICKENDIGFIPAVKYGKEHEHLARKSFCDNIVKKHLNGKLLDCGLLASSSFPFIRATPDNIFTCRCCGENSDKVPVEIKCPFKIKDKNVLEAYEELDFLEKNAHGEVCLSRSHKYYSQVTTQTALLGAKYAFFFVWTPIGDPLIEKIYYDAKHWAELERNAIVFFKSHVSFNLLLQLRNICVCPCCEKFCLEPEEIERPEENSIQYSDCCQWYHWSCCGISNEFKGDWMCRLCTRSIGSILDEETNMI